MRFIIILRFLLLPLSILYGVVVSIRNWMYDVRIFKSTMFDFPIITVGNLSVGGTGKTPQIEYLIRLLQSKYSLAVLSRGYKRKSKGFVLGTNNSTVLDLGDEPYQYHQKFDKIQVAVDGDRVAGVQQIKNLKPETNIVLLDDAYQHRKIKAGFQILLTSYDKIFYNDFMMPTGNLRELWWGKKRADIIIVTKCSDDLSEEEQHKIRKRLGATKNQLVLFSKVNYGAYVSGSNSILLDDFIKQKIVLVTGIAKPKPLIDFLKSKQIEVEHLEYPDHHHFTDVELNLIRSKAKNAKILTTEKDYVRLEHELQELYYLPIEIQFLNNSKMFDEAVLNFVNS